MSDLKPVDLAEARRAINCLVFAIDNSSVLEEVTRIVQGLVDEIERLRAALTECCAPFDSGPTTVMGGAALLAAEFQRRMDIAGSALSPPPAKK